MNNQRLKQFALSLSVVLSLLISSLSICACAHHQENKLTESSCHEHSEMLMAMDTPADANQADTIQNVISGSADCNCVKPAPKAFSKSEFLQIEKQTAAVALVISFQAELITQILTDNPANFVQPFQLSDSSYNIRSPRAPPRL